MICFVRTWTEVGDESEEETEVRGGISNEVGAGGWARAGARAVAVAAAWIGALMGAWVASGSGT